jgi:hypothetical protein
LYSIPVFILAMVIEGYWTRRRPTTKGYEKRDAAASITMGLFNVIVSTAITLLPIPFLWDRLFGSFAPETEPVTYGLTKDIETFNPLRIAFHELAAIGRDVRRAPTLVARLGYALAPPGWSHDGSSLTATQLQRSARRSQATPVCREPRFVTWIGWELGRATPSEACKS